MTASWTARLAGAAAATAFLLAAAGASAQTPAYRDQSLDVEARVEDLLARMTLDEKVAQLVAVWESKTDILDDSLRFDPAKMSARFPHGVGQLARPQDARGPGSPRGPATNPSFDVVAHAGAQVKAALDATVALAGENYVFWGGREGYSCLFNTLVGRELDHLARFLAMARDYGRSIGFRGTFLVEPKPMEPMYHQYDSDAAAVIGFLKRYGLDADFKLNIEANHATLAGKRYAHELQLAADAGLLGSIDANRGNAQNGWDTDQFPTDLYDAVEAMLVVLGDGGFKTGGLNFDAKVRRESTDLEDLFIAHIGGMDTYARALVVADTLLERSPLPAARRRRYASFDEGPGKAFEEGRLTLEDLRDHAAKAGEPVRISGKEEWIQNVINDYIARAARP